MFVLVLASCTEGAEPASPRGQQDEQDEGAATSSSSSSSSSSSTSAATAPSNAPTAAAGEKPTNAGTSPERQVSLPNPPPVEEYPLCSAAASFCQVFEPGGASRWGCHTLHTVPELACEHAADASVARCNCSGGFGDYPEGRIMGHGEPMRWFEIPADSTIFSAERVVEIWRERCDVRCVNAPPE